MNIASAFSVSLYSKAGGRTKNEDVGLFSSHPADETVLICVLADGQGGRPGGQAAAETACRVALEVACAYSLRQLCKSKTWGKILRAADSAVREQPEAGATTLVALCILGDSVYGASSGDSAAVLLNVYDQYHELSAEQLKNPPIGSGNAKIVPFSQPLLDPWLVMLASDGLWKYVGWPGVKSILQTHQIEGGKSDELTTLLVDAARSAGQRTLSDDTTVIVVESSKVVEPSKNDNE